MTKNTQEQADAFKGNTEAFLSLSEVAFSGFERLSALNLNVARAAFEEGITASQSLSRVRNTSELKDLPSPFGRHANEQMSSYFRSVQEIVTEMQDEINRLVTRQMASFGTGGAANDMMSRMFTQVAQQASDMTKYNLKAASDSTEQLTASVVAQSKKSA